MEEIVVIAFNIHAQTINFKYYAVVKDQGWLQWQSSPDEGG